MPHDAEQEFDPRAYLLSGDDFEWVLNDHGYKFSGRVGQLDRPEQDRDPIYSKNVRTVSPDIVLEQSSSGKKIARVILAYFGSHFSQRFTSPPTLNRYLGELETAIEANSHNAMIALDKRWDRRGEREKDVIGEAFEQPGPDMPDEGQVPGEQPVDDFDVREYFLADNTKGAERLKWLDKSMRNHDDDRYTIAYAHTGYSCSFEEQANYEYFKRNYTWLNYDANGSIGFDRGSIERPYPNNEDAEGFELYLSRIDDDEWDQFQGEVVSVRHGECMDDDRSNELQMEAETEYFNDGCRDFIKALRKQQWMHRGEYQWLLQAINHLEGHDVAELCRRHENYAESQGDGTVYLDFDEAAEAVEPDEVIEVLSAYKEFETSKADWEKTKNDVWRSATGPGYLFDKEMQEQLVEQPELHRRYTNMDPLEVKALFDRAVSESAEFPKNNEYPRWIYVNADYGRGGTDRWVLMYPVDRADWIRWDDAQRQEHIVGSMYEFVRDYAIPVLRAGAKVPKDHPEFDFGARQPGPPSDDVNRYLPPQAPPAQESVEAAPEPAFDPREYLTAEPMGVPEWLAAHGFVEVANDTWQWENDFHMVMAVRHSFRSGDVWEVDDNDVEGHEYRYRWTGADADSSGFLRVIRQAVERKLELRVEEAEQPVPEPPGSDPDEFDARSYFTEPLDSGKLVKETETMRIIVPSEDTAERYVVTRSNGNMSWNGAVKYPLYMVIPKKSAKTDRFIIGIRDDGTLYTPTFDDDYCDRMLRGMEFSKDLRRFLRSHATRYLKDGDEQEGVRMLAQLYGSKAVLKYLDKYDISDDLKLKLGIDAAKRGDIKTASKLLSHPEELLKPNTCSWLFKDWSDMAQFYETPYQESAENILSGESVDASWVYDHKPEIEQIVAYLSEEQYRSIREILPHRTIQPYEDKGPVMLTTELVKEFSNVDIAYWLENREEVDPQGELNDIRDALQQAACRAWESVLQDDYFKGYSETVLDALDAEATWQNHKLRITVKWSDVASWLDDAGDEATNLVDLIRFHSPRAVPSDDYSRTSWDEAGNLDEFIDNEFNDLDMPDFPYDQKQLTMPDVMGPNPNEYLSVTSYNQWSPLGFRTKMKRKDVDSWNREEPWRLNAEKWAEYAKVNNIEIPPKDVPPAPSVGESLASALLEKEYRYATTQIDVPAPQSDFIFEWGRLNVPDEKLFFDDPNNNPRETEQHVTVLFGLTVNEVPEELRRITEAMKPFPVYIGKVSLFRQETHDVVKLDVESPWLRKLSAQIRAAIPNENKYPDYKPHLTIAYVKKGSCDDLEGMDIFANGQETGVNPQFTAYGVVFKGAGDSDGNRVHDTLLFSRVKKTRPVESEPFSALPFPLAPEQVGRFLKATRSHAQRTIL